MRETMITGIDAGELREVLDSVPDEATIHLRWIDKETVILVFRHEIEVG